MSLTQVKTLRSAARWRPRFGWVAASRTSGAPNRAPNEVADPLASSPTRHGGQRSKKLQQLVAPDRLGDHNAP